MARNDLFDDVTAIISAPDNPYISRWKASGKPVIGYFCQYAPPELLLAAGALPVRLRGAGSEDSASGDALMSSRVCTFVRHVMSLVLDDAYDFLDGEISVNTCDHVRRAADVFTKKSALPFHGFISVPRTPRESLFDYYLGELRKLQAALAEHFKVVIDRESLNRAIRQTNGTRRRLSALNQLRRLERPKLSGAKALSVHIAAQLMPPDDFAELADNLLAELESFEGYDPPTVRLFVTGAELDEPAYIAAIESQDALVVADDICFGERSVFGSIDENSDDPLDAIARATFFRTSCARMIGDFPNRWERLNRRVAETKADGVIFQRLIFCDPWGAEQHNLLHRLQSDPAFPILSLLREYGVVPTGQLRTRVQAFVEKIEIARVRNGAAGGGA